MFGFVIKCIETFSIRTTNRKTVFHSARINIEQARQLLNEMYSFELKEEVLEILIGGLEQKSYSELAEKQRLIKI